VGACLAPAKGEKGFEKIPFFTNYAGQPSDLLNFERFATGNLGKKRSGRKKQDLLGLAEHERCG